MEWSEWITEARLAIVIALVSAAFSGGQFVYTRRLAVNDTVKMKRKTPALEARFMRCDEFAGWQECHIEVRNFEPNSVDLVSLSVRSKGMRILAYGEQFKQEEGSQDRRTLVAVSELPFKRSIPLDRRLSPVGSRSMSIAGLGDFATDTTSLSFLTYGVSSVRDLRLDWEWSDGQGR